ncbi:MAG: response regulator [Desulforhopalus sp.]
MVPDSVKEIVLVVDDEEVLLEIACEILNNFGYRTLRARSGKEALAKMKKAATPIDLVLLDLNMPGMGGYKCLLKIREIHSAPKVIIASGYAANGNTQHMKNSGASAFMQKPYQLQELIATVRECLDSEDGKFCHRFCS